MTASEVARAWREKNGIRSGFVIVHPSDHSCLWRETLDDGEIVNIIPGQDLFCSRRVDRYFAFDADGAAFVIAYDADRAVYFWTRHGGGA